MKSPNIDGLNAAERKGIPIYSGFINYFPLAIIAVAECSKAGNDQHNPGKPLFWDRSKSGDELDALSRHLIDAGTMDSDGIRHSTKVAWRALANLQKELEAEQGASTLSPEDYNIIPAGAVCGQCSHWHRCEKGNSKMQRSCGNFTGVGEQYDSQ
jgi:hypothetical protein